MPDTYVVVTGPIVGRIPHGNSYVDVTPELLVFDTEEERDAVSESIELEHAVRGTHPLDVECVNLDNPALHPDGAPEDVVEAHRAAHKALKKKAGL